MLVHRHAAAVVGDRQAVAFLQRHLDPVGMAGDRLVHRVVEHFGGEVVQRAVVGAADIHAGAAPDGLEPFQHLDRGGIVIAAARGQFFEQVVGHATSYRRAEFPRYKRRGAVYPPYRSSEAASGAGSTTVTAPLPTWRTSIARSATPSRRKRNGPSMPRKPPDRQQFEVGKIACPAASRGQRAGSAAPHRSPAWRCDRAVRRSASCSCWRTGGSDRRTRPRTTRRAALRSLSRLVLAAPQFGADDARARRRLRSSARGAAMAARRAPSAISTVSNPPARRQPLGRADDRSVATVVALGTRRQCRRAPRRVSAAAIVARWPYSPFGTRIAKRLRALSAWHNSTRALDRLLGDDAHDEHIGARDGGIVGEGDQRHIDRAAPAPARHRTLSRRAAGRGSACCRR